MNRINNAVSGAPLLPFTVQCGFATYMANTVVVEAVSPDDACRLAIEAANASDSWKSIDHCGSTFVDAIAEGADADPWTRGGSVLPVPAEFAEQDGLALRAVLLELLDWAAMMGGWKAEVWRAAERAVGRSTTADEARDA